MMYSALLVICLGLYLVLATRNLRLALIALAGLLPTYLLRFSIGPIPFTLLEGFVLIFLSTWALTHRPFLKQPMHPWVFPATLLIAAACFGVVVAPDTFSALGIWKAYFIEPILIALAASTILQPQDWKRLFLALAGSALALSVFALFQWGTGLAIPVPWDIERRVTSVFPYPNALGLFLAPIVSLLLTYWWSTKRSLSRLQHALFLLSVGLSSIAIILAKTEAAFIAIPAGPLIALALSNVSRTTKLRIISEGIIIAAVIFLTVPVVQQKVLLQDGSGLVRQSQWQETSRMLLDRPAFGAGLNGYAEALMPYHDNTLYEIYQYPHNLLLNIWSELGLLGLIAFCWLAWIVVRTTHAHPTPIRLACFAALATMTIHGLVDVPYFKNDLAILTWLCIIGVVQIQSKQKRSG